MRRARARASDGAWGARTRVACDARSSGGTDGEDTTRSAMLSRDLYVGEVYLLKVSGSLPGTAGDADDTHSAFGGLGLLLTLGHGIGGQRVDF